MFIHFFEDIPIASVICIYGTGKRGINLKKQLNKRRKDVEVKCFIDSYKNNEIIDKLEVINLNTFIEKKIDYDFIILASNFWQEIKENISIYDLKYKLLGFHFATCLEEPPTVENHVTLDGQKQEEYTSYLKIILNSLEDESDRNLYKKLFDLRFGNYSHKELFEEFSNKKELFFQYLNFINKDEIEVLIDCGVYDASGIDLLLRYLDKIKKIYGFEPLKQMYCSNIEDILPKDKVCLIDIIEKAAYTHKTSLNIEVGNHFSNISNNDSESSKQIKTISLDEFVEENQINKVDFLKLDIENAEIYALKGAKHMIERFRPQIATSIYHSNEQFFEVPLYLIENLKNYIFKIGHYSTNLAETVLYAVPNEKYKTISYADYK